MSCNSLVTYEAAGVDAVTSVLSYNVSGSTSVAGYTTPGWTTTTTVPAVSHWHKVIECIGGATGGNCNPCNCVTTSWFSDVLCETCCSSIRWNPCKSQATIYTETFTHPQNVHKYSGIPLVGSTTFSASATITITFVSSAEVLIPPPKDEQVVFVESMVFTVSNFNIGFDELNINIPITESFTAQLNSAGTFDAQIGMPDSPYSVDQTISIDGVGNVTYGFSLNPYILLCATPSGGASFVNLCAEVYFSISCNNPVTNEPISFTQGFSVLCPTAEE